MNRAHTAHLSKQAKVVWRVKPAVLIDIDGVCSPMCSSDRMPVRWAPWERVQCGWNRGWVSATLGAALRALTEGAELFWCTGWEEEAARFGTHLGVDAPWVPLGAGSVDRMWKLPGVESHLAGRPLWWIDDEHDDSSRQWAADRTASGVPTTVVACDPDVGVTSDDVEAAARWTKQFTVTGTDEGGVSLNR